MTDVPALAVITLDAQGGGVAAVSRLLRQVFVDRWGSRCPVLELAPGGAHAAPSTLARLRFGARLAADQLLGRCAWTLHGHLAVARAQAYVPALMGRPYAVFLHGIEAWRPLATRQHDVLARAALRIANSRYTAARVVSAHPGIGPITVCPLALPPDRVADAASSRSRPDEALGPHVVLVVGRMLASERYKGHDELLDAWPLVASRVPDARLVFVGDGDDIARLRAKADDLGVASSVTLTGFLDDARLRSVYRSAAVFAMPSRDEGFGLVYLEAMAYGVPCIGSPHDAAGDVIEDQVSGYLISPDDTATLAARLVDLLTDEHRRHAMGEAGRRRVREHFGYSRFRDGLLTLLDDALGERQRSRQQTRARADSHVT